MKRPKLHILFDGLARVYDWTDADALFESLETELSDTRRALERLIKVILEEEGEATPEDVEKAVKLSIDVARRERTEEIKRRLGE